MTTPIDQLPMNTHNAIPQFRTALLQLHKTLIDFEKKQYEGKYGRIASSGKFLSIVMEHPSFAWLRQLSELILGIDEMLDKKNPAEVKSADLFAYARKLLQPSESGTPFEKKYFRAVHHEPSVALAHAKVMKILKMK